MGLLYNNNHSQFISMLNRNINKPPNNNLLSKIYKIAFRVNKYSKSTIFCKKKSHPNTRDNFY